MLRRRQVETGGHQPLEGTVCLHFRLEDEGNKFLRQPLTGLHAVLVRKLKTIAVKSADKYFFIDAHCDTELMSYNSQLHS